MPNIFFNVLGCEWNVQLHVPILKDELTLQFNSQLEIHIFLGEKPQFLRLKSTFLQVGILIFAGPFRSTFAPTPEICRFADDGLGRRSAGSFVTGVTSPTLAEMDSMKHPICVVYEWFMMFVKCVVYYTINHQKHGCYFWMPKRVLLAASIDAVMPVPMLGEL